MPFDPDQYIAQKSTFNPDQYLADKTAEQKSSQGMGEDKQAFLSGIADQAAGLIGKKGADLKAMAQYLTPDPNAALDKELQARGTKINQPDFHDIQANTQMYQNDTDRQKKDYPTEYTGGLLTGGALESAPFLASPATSAYKFGKGLMKSDLVKFAAPIAAYLYGKRH